MSSRDHDLDERSAGEDDEDVKGRINEAVTARKERLQATVRRVRERTSPVAILAALGAAAALALLVRRQRENRR